LVCKGNYLSISSQHQVYFKSAEDHKFASSTS